MNTRASTGGLGLKATIVLAGILVIAAAAARVQAPHLDVPFDTDEADYASALSNGPLSNYLGLAERSGWDFLISTGREFMRTGRARPFRDDWAIGDAAALRHYHPPVALYPAAALLASGQHREHVVRLVSLVTALLSCVASAWLAWALAGDLAPPVRAVIALCALALTALSPWHVTTSVVLSFHQGFWLLSTLALGCATLVWRTGSTRAWYAFSLLLGVAVATVPYWLLLMPIAAGILWWAPWPPAQKRPRLALRGLALAALSLTIVWPPALLRGDLVKPAMLYTWIVVEPLSPGGRSASWPIAFVQSHWWALVIPLVPVFLWRDTTRRLFRNALPVVAFVGVFVALNSRVHHMKPLYAAAVIPAAAALASLAFGALASPWIRRFPLPIAAAGCALTLLAVLPWHSGERQPDWRPAMAELTSRLSGRTVLIAPRPVAGTFRYYLTASRIVVDAAEPDDESVIASMLSSGDITDALALPVSRKRVQSMLPSCFEREPDLRIASMRVHHWRRSQACQPS